MPIGSVTSDSAGRSANTRPARPPTLSSINEGLPISLGEAMACGVPSVAFDCAPGVREMVTDGEDGIVVPPLDVPALARGIERLIEDEPLRRRMGARARESARRFTKETILDRWEE